MERSRQRPRREVGRGDDRAGRDHAGVRVDVRTFGPAPDATGFVALRTAYLARAILDILVLDGPRTTNDSYGFRFDAKCFSMGEDQAIESILYQEFMLKPCISTAGNAAYSVVVTTGAPVYTTLVV